MLSGAENKNNVTTLKLLSYVNMLPLKVKTVEETGSVQLERCQENSLRLLIWRLLLLLGILDCIYLIVRLYQVILYGSPRAVSYVPVHFQFIVLTAMTCFWHYNVFERHVDNTLATLNDVLKLVCQGSSDFCFTP